MSTETTPSFRFAGFIASKDDWSSKAAFIAAAERIARGESESGEMTWIVSEAPSIELWPKGYTEEGVAKLISLGELCEGWSMHEGTWLHVIIRPSALTP
jgi:hypothetical protein